MTTGISQETFSALVGAIYDCALEPDHWHDTLAEIAQELGFCNAVMDLVSLPEGKPMLNIAYNMSPENLERIAAYAGDIIKVWGGLGYLMSFDMREPQVISHLQTPEKIQSSAYAQEWAWPQGVFDCMMIGLVRDNSMIATVGFGRHEDQGEIQPTEIDAARLLIPHLQRSIATNRLFDVKSAVAASFEATLNALTSAVILVDEHLRVVYANRVAEELVGGGSALRLANGCVQATSPTLMHSLQKATAMAARNDLEIGRRSFGIHLGLHNENPAILHVLPLRFGKLRSGLIPDAVAALFIATAVAPPRQQHEAMASLFDLTPAETKVLSVVGSGKSQSQAAASLSLGNETVKYHLRHIFSKTGTRRQAELVHLLSSLTIL